MAHNTNINASAYNHNTNDAITQSNTNANRNQTSVSEGNPTRPDTGVSVASARRKRPRTTASRRRNTARLDTSTSSIGEVPDQEFFREGDEYSDGSIGDFSEEEGEAAEVFAFARPGTAAPPGGLGDTHDDSQPPTASTRMGDNWGGSEYARPGTAVTFNLPPHDAQRVLPIRTDGRSTYEAPSTIGSPALSQTTTAFTSNPPTDGQPQLNSVSVLDYGDNTSTAYSAGTPRPHTGISAKPSFMSTSSYATSLGEDDESYTSSYDKTGKPIRMRSMQKLVLGNRSGYGDELDTIPGSRTGSRGTWVMSDADGSMTVPDGMTTRGDGKGRMYEKDDLEVQTHTDAGEYAEEEDSPYEEVRASVSNIDDPDMPALTVRSWFLGMGFAIVGCAINVFFQFRNPLISIPAIVVQVIAYPIGKFLAHVLPLYTIKFPKWLGGYEIDLNPGPFNIKEHTVIVVMANVAFGPSSGLHASVTAQIYYGVNVNAVFTILLVLSTQVAGLGLAGIARRFLVWPASMIWPYNLVIATNLNTFHAEDDKYSGGMTRFRFFIVMMCAAFAYYFLPGFLFSALSYFSWVCWIKPNNIVINQLFGVQTGLGMGLLSFDWNQIVYVASPLTTPWWAEANIAVGFIFFYWIVCPIMYYQNVWNFAYLPISVSTTIDRYGSRYNITRILHPGNHTLDVAAYREYSPVFISATLAMTYMLAFALSTAIVVHTALHHGPSIVQAVRHVYSEPDDIHMKLMRQYPEVPDWWYMAIMALTIVFGIVAIEVFKTGFPVYALFVALLLPAVYFLPAGFIYALTAQSVAINLLAELIPGYMLPGSPVSNMIFKSYSTQTLYEAVQFTQGLKLGHYMKVPPRSMFWAQTSSVIVSCFVSIGVKEWLFHVVKDICSPGQKNLLTCPYETVYGSVSTLWGAIGPNRLFGKGGLYHPEVYALVFGAVLPIPFWFAARKYPRSFLRKFSWPVILNGPLSIPPATGINYAMFLLVGFIFQFVIRRRHFAWWAKYNYTLSAALDVGTILSGLFIFLALGLPNVSLDWIGNNVYQNTADAQGASFLEPPIDGFGPATWE